MADYPEKLAALVEDFASITDRTERAESRAEQYCGLSCVFSPQDIEKPYRG